MDHNERRSVPYGIVTVTETTTTTVMEQLKDNNMGSDLQPNADHHPIPVVRPNRSQPFTVPLRRPVVPTPPTNNHRLVAIVNSSVVPTTIEQHSTPCEACRLRVKPPCPIPSASMMCPACTDRPALCSAQCYLWWHRRARAEMQSPPSSTHASNVTTTATMAGSAAVLIEPPPTEATAIERPGRIPFAHRRRVNTTAARAKRRRRLFSVPRRRNSRQTRYTNQVASLQLHNLETQQMLYSPVNGLFRCE